ncbi:MAG: SIMPL domain-containing protein [Notoacmeibacter sp.]|nr:SIMPL domain-containing protein [Notoacmeibacter sp.]MCC0033258.1 SIMPL domain-containing protein [Brucellaceae bacterium]
MKNAMLAAALAATLSATPALAEDPVPRIMVTGTGQAALAPDLAILSLTVMREGETAREALDANNAAMGDVLKAMKAEGIADRDLQTSGFSISPRYVYPKASDGGDQTPRIVSYQVANNLTVRVRDIAKVGTVLDKSVTLGVNQGGSVSFGNDDTTAALAEAREKAMADAIAKAGTLAKAAGVKTGKVLEITENVNFARPEPLARTMAMKAEADAVPLAAGENTYTVTVNVTFAIDQ